MLRTAVPSWQPGGYAEKANTQLSPASGMADALSAPYLAQGMELPSLAWSQRLRGSKEALPPALFMVPGLGVSPPAPPTCANSILSPAQGPPLSPQVSERAT